MSETQISDGQRRMNESERRLSKLRVRMDSENKKAELKAKKRAQKRTAIERKYAQNYIAPSRRRKVCGIGQQIALVPGGIMEFMRWAKGAAARDKRFLPVVESFDAMLPSRQNAQELENICVTLGVPPYDLLGACITIGAERQRDETRLIASLAMPKVMRVNIRQAQKPKSIEDRRMFMQSTGLLPTPTGSVINLSAQANANATNKGEPSGLSDFEDSVVSFSEVIRNAVDVTPLLPEPSEHPIQDAE